MKRRLLLAAALASAAIVGHLIGRFDALPGTARVVGVVEAPVGGLGAPSALEIPVLGERPVRNVVLVVGDGMGIAQLAAARIRAFGPEGRFVLERLPVSGYSATHAEGALIAKSDSAATAIASGVKTVNGRIGTAADGRVLPTLLEAAREAGLATGLVTTTAIFDATPAAFAAHVERRRDYAEIIDQMATAGIDLMIGGGVEGFLPQRSGGRRPDDRDLLAEAAARGVVVATDAAALAAAARLPLWGLFPGTSLGVEPSHPTIGEMADKALALLAAEGDRRGSGFFLLIEEEGIDSSGHAGDLEGLAAAVMRLDRAVESAVRFAGARGDTLVVVTADHSTGGLQIDHTSTGDRLRVVWTSDQHAGEPVPIFAYGPPAAALRFTGLLDNSEVHDAIAAALGFGAGDDEALEEPEP